MLPSLPMESQNPTAERFRSAFEHAPVAAWFADTTLRLTEVNHALCRMLGRSSEELLGRRLSEFTHPDERRLDEHEAAAMLSGELVGHSREKQLLRPDGNVIWALVGLSLVRDAEGLPSYFLGQATDISEQRSREQHLRHLADHDPLTGLVNRRGFGRELRRHVSRLARYGARGALLMLDLDNFKRYNDAHGHAGGDELLRTVASTLNARLRGGDVLGRIGGDEFAVLLPEATPEQAEVVAAALVQAVREAGRLREPAVTVSVGIFCFDEDGRLSEDRAMIGADLAMYAAKHAGRDRHASKALWTSGPRSRRMSGRYTD